jgi:predicted permease
VLFDILGTLVAGYGLGVFIAGQASRHRANDNSSVANRVGEAGLTITTTKRGSFGALLDSLTEVAKNPTFYAFFVGLYLKTLAIPDWLISGLGAIAWSSIMIALIVMGMRIQQLSTKLNLKLAIQPVLIKTILVPLVLAAALTAFGFEGPQRLVLILQSAMPCGFVSLVLAENYGLDVELTVASILLSCIVFAFMLPVWTTLFTTW